MASKTSKKRKRKIKRLLKRLGIFGVVLVVVGAIFAYLLSSGLLEEWFSDEEKKEAVGGTVEFHFIDVGQGDAALIRTEEGNVLIDAGTNASEEALIAYLKEEGVKELAYAVFTHPHEDHIGGADAVLEYCKVEKVILPDATANTKVFERMMDAIEAEGSDVIMATPDATYKIGDLKLTVLAPNASEYKDVNNYSVVIRANFGDTSVLFTGDAEDVSEKEMLERYGSGKKLNCDLLKVGFSTLHRGFGKSPRTLPALFL